MKTKESVGILKMKTVATGHLKAGEQQQISSLLVATQREQTQESFEFEKEGSEEVRRWRVRACRVCVCSETYTNAKYAMTQTQK